MRISKRIIFFIFFSFLVFVTHAESKKLTILCDIWPPYQTVENGRLSGFSTKIVSIVFKRMGADVATFKPYPWKRAILMIERGKADALFSANFTKARADFAFYPDEPIVTSPWVIWGNKDNKIEFRSFDDLYGKTVGIVRGYSYTPEFWNFAKKYNVYVEVPNDEMNFKKLNAGRIDFALAEFGNGVHIVKRLNLNKIIPFVKNPVKTDGLYIIFNKKTVSTSFVNAFSKELKKLKKKVLPKFI
ncbi:MAG: transporter substrate-binding domain-containing protein [Desulfobacter sp.]|nr:MAG: transporter substrate-binding domain-containing protein [Desulfobacter sp.]